MKDMKVPRMTPDIFYGFEGELMNRQLDIPEMPVRDRVFRSDYRINGKNLVIHNGPNLFNRPLYTPGCKTYVTAGDRPAFILWTNNNYKKSEDANWGIPDTFGYSYIGLGSGAFSKWLHEFDVCDTTYHPGWVGYRLGDDTFPGIAVNIELIPHTSGAVFIHVEISRDNSKTDSNVQIPEIIWTHGCISYEGWNCWANSYDPQSRSIPWDQPELALDDSIEFSSGLAVLKDSKDMKNWVAVGTYPAAYELLAVDAGKRLNVTPAEIFEYPAKDKPIAAGKVRLEENSKGKSDACIILNWGRNSEPSAVMQPIVEGWRECSASGREYFCKRSETISIHTPNKELDAVFGFAAVASDSMWHSPGINHGAYSWGGAYYYFQDLLRPYLLRGP